MQTNCGGWPSEVVRPIHPFSSMRHLILLALACVTLSACDTRTNASVARTDTIAAAKGDIALALETKVVAARVRAGATLASMLRANNVAVAETAAIVAQAASVFD